MTVNELIEKLDLKAVALPCGERETCGAYCGDLLSWVMGRAESGNVWVTIMSNINVVAVASLADVSAVILAEGVEVDDEVKKTALERSVNLLSSNESTYNIAKQLGKVI